MVGRRDVRGHVAPVLEQLPRPRRVGDERAWVRAETSEERQLLAAHENVDRVDLDQPDPVEHPSQVAAVDAADRTPIGETLGGEGHPARLIG